MKQPLCNIYSTRLVEASTAERKTEKQEKWRYNEEATGEAQIHYTPKLGNTSMKTRHIDTYAKLACPTRI